MDKNQIREVIARRAALELRDGDVVNLGIGLPTLVPNYLDPGVKVTLQSENGLLGMGPEPETGKEDDNYTNAGGGYITYFNGASAFDSSVSFSIIRGGHVDVTILGALEVDEKGNLANWMIPGKLVPGMGGAMDLVTGAKKVIVAMEHCDKNGNSKVLKECTLPLTAKGKVSLIVTDMAVLEVRVDGLILKEISEGYTIDEVVAATEAKLILPETISYF